MPRPRQIPKFRLHKASGQAAVSIDGRDVYLGPYSDPASRQKYDRLIAEWLARGRAPAATVRPPTVQDVLAQYWEFAQTYYRKNDQATTQLGRIQTALTPLRRLYAQLPAAEFTPIALEVVQQQFIDAQRCRTSVNALVGCVRRMFKWAASRSLVPPETWHGLLALMPLRAGRTPAPERDPVKPVPEAAIDAIKPHVSRQVWAMIELQRATGMRPGEVCGMHARDIDMSGPVWVYAPEHHKGEHHGHARHVYIGPAAQDVIRPFLTLDPNRYLFSPAEADAECRAARKSQRKTRVPPVQRMRAKRSKRRTTRARPIQDHYTVCSYRRAITRGCDAADAAARGLAPPFKCPACALEFQMHGKLRSHAARAHALTLEPLKPPTIQCPAAGCARRFRVPAALCRHARAAHALTLAPSAPDASDERIVPRWHPHQLRHSFATRVRKEHGVEVARVLLGHRSLSSTELYAERDNQLAMRIAAGDTASRSPHPHAGKASVRLTDGSTREGA